MPTPIFRTACLLASCALPVASQAAAPAALRATVDQAIRPVMKRFGVPGMAVAVTVDGKRYFFNYGMASRAERKPVSEATLFELGSISKVFTATLAAQAEALGKLSLQDHPGAYLPELKGAPIDKATLLHLGTYTAGGLPLQFPETLTAEKMVDYYREWQPDDAPGAVRVYSNPSIGLFGLLAARALGRDFDEAMQEQLGAFGMRDSYLRVPAGAMPNYAWGHNQKNETVRVNPGVLAGQAYGVKANSADMLRFVEANIDTAGLAPPLQRAVAATQLGRFKVGTMVQGLGWEQYAYPVALVDLLAGNSPAMLFDPNPAVALTAAPSGPVLLNKTGSTGGFGAYVALVPARKIGVVILANKSYPIADRVRIGYAILQRIGMAAQ